MKSFGLRHVFARILVAATAVAFVTCGTDSPPSEDVEPPTPLWATITGGEPLSTSMAATATSEAYRTRIAESTGTICNGFEIDYGLYLDDRRISTDAFLGMLNRYNMDHVDLTVAELHGSIREILGSYLFGLTPKGETDQRFDSAIAELRRSCSLFSTAAFQAGARPGSS